jgi:hypothetical protein
VGGSGGDLVEGVIQPGPRQAFAARGLALADQLCQVQMQPFALPCDYIGLLLELGGAGRSAVQAARVTDHHTLPRRISAPVLVLYVSVVNHHRALPASHRWSISSEVQVAPQRERDPFRLG